MIDLHTHILPGLDDGAEDMSEALEMARMSADSGVQMLVVTPHSNQVGRFENYYSKSLYQAYADFKEAVKAAGIKLNLYQGMEIFADDDVIEKIKSQHLIGLNGGDTYLIEFPFDAEPYFIGEILEEILDLGKRPLIAHPERYFCVIDYPQLVYGWMRMGCLTQINKGSVIGKFGRHVKIASKILLEHELVTCIASDAHSAYMRTTHMSEVRNYIEMHYGKMMAEQLFYRNPRKILTNESITFHGTRSWDRGGFF